VLPKEMTHNVFDILMDLMEPMKSFFVENKIHTSTVKGKVTSFKYKYFIPPKDILEQGTQEE